MTHRNSNESLSEGAPAKITGRQWLTVLLLLGTGFMLSVDFSILNVAMPQVGAAVGIGFADLPWIATAYALPAAGFTLLFGRIADLFGRRRLFLIGIALLVVSSIIGGFATNAEMLLIARTLQGLATAIATPAALALLIISFIAIPRNRTFSRPSLRGRRLRHAGLQVQIGEEISHVPAVRMRVRVR